jgi:hypothetical protein
MLVPEFWAEARAQERKAGGQTTVRRFGWSMTSEADALAMAEKRVAEALARIGGGESLSRREPKVPYNGAEGVPIREEVVRRHGDDVVTRNSYGARCLNTPDVWIADVDFAEELPLGVVAATVVSLAVASMIGVRAIGSTGLALVALVVSLLCSWFVAKALEHARRLVFGPAEMRARRRIAKFVARRPDWRVRVHRTPNGLRLLALHSTIEPDDPECARAFHELGVDPLYAKMCLRQHCYRARLDAKPWRIGISTHMKPRPGVWPVSPGRRAQRSEWLAKYETTARPYAACRFEEEIGDGTTSERALTVSRLHDELAGALTDRPIA